MQNKGNGDNESATTPASSVSGATPSQKTTDNSHLNDKRVDDSTPKKVDDIVGPGQINVKVLDVDEVKGKTDQLNGFDDEANAYKA